MTAQEHSVYKEPSIISGVELPSGQKVSLGLLAAVTLEVVHLGPNAPVAAFLPYYYVW
jgi:hypothetical protein